MSVLLQALPQRHREPVHPLGDTPDPLRAMIHRVHCGHVRQQRLRRAYITRRLIPPDMLLPRLQGESVSLAVVRVPGYPDHATWHQTHEFLPAGEETGVRTTVAEGNAETLRRAHADVHVELARGFRDGQRE